MKTNLKGFTAWYYASENCTISMSEHVSHSEINPLISEILSACSYADYHLKKGQKMILSFMKGVLQIGIIKTTDGSIGTKYIARAVKNNQLISDIRSDFDSGMLACLLLNDIKKV